MAGYANRSAFHVLVFAIQVWITSGQPHKTEFDPQAFCSRRPNGPYGHPSDCFKFVICSNGHGFLQACPPGMAFQLTSNACDFRHKVQCDDDKSSAENLNGYATRNTVGSTTSGSNADSHPSRPVPSVAGHRPPLQPSPTAVSGTRPQAPPPAHGQHSRLPARRRSGGVRWPGGDPHRPPGGRSSPDRPAGGRVPDGAMTHHVHSDIPDVDLSFLRSPHGAPKSSENEVAPCAQDGSFPDPHDCTRYVQCSNGQPYVTSCPLGTYYSSLTKNCGYDQGLCVNKPWTLGAPRPDASPTQDGGGHQRRPASGESTSGQPDDSPLRRGSLQSSRELFEHGPDNDINIRGEFNMNDVMSRAEDLMSRAMARTRQVHRQEALMARDMSVIGHRAFSGVQAFLGSTPYIKQISIPAFAQLEALRMLKTRYGVDKSLLNRIFTEMPPLLRPNPEQVGPDMDLPTPTMEMCPYPTNNEHNLCDSKSPFRTFDGSCNNLKRPLWGKSMRPLARFIPPDYADGIGLPRVSRRGRHLPSARAVSLQLFEDRDQPSHVHTLMHMTFGQFMDHDFSRAAVTKLSKDESGIGKGEMVDVTCGESECETKGPENRACLPIQVNRGTDPDFFNKTCLMFVRTQEVPRDDCKLGPREQINQLTSHLDASMVYGNDRKQAVALRDPESSRGRLKVTEHPYEARYKSLLPQKENKDCRELNATVQCFTAGDGRVNEHVGLAGVHTVFLRAHNVWEERLHRINPHWSGERLYQETRRIMVAAMQVITYNEYLPLVLGPQEMDRYGLNLQKSGFYHGYDVTTSTDIANVFTTAAFRFGHSQVDELIRFAHQAFSRFTDTELSNVLRRPGKVYETSLPGGSGVDSILLGHISQAAQTVDRFFTKQVTAQLFSESPPNKPGTDLPALNIQRGRDHGLPGYNDWREWCDLPRAATFDDLVDIPEPEMRWRLSQLYDTPDDLDLFAGGVVERHVPGGMVGPTFACIIGRQFRNIKIGDRFWHECPSEEFGFSPGQLQEVRKLTLSRVMCDNLDNIDHIQKFVFLQPLSEAFGSLGSQNYAEAYSLASLYRGERNERRPCSNIPDIDLGLWRE